MLLTASKSHEMPLQLDAVKKCFTGMMTTHRDDVKKELSKLMDRVKRMGRYITKTCLAINREYFEQ